MLSRRVFAQGMVGALSALALSPDRATERPTLTLLDSFKLKQLKLQNRVLMAPMTRGRAGQERTPNALMAEYYAQRAGAGLIITEGTAISPQGYGWVGSPGIYNQAQTSGWKVVTEAVHSRGGLIFLQLWHTGRVSHPDFLDGRAPIGPSAIQAQGKLHTPFGKKSFVTPRSMTRQDIAEAVQEYADAAHRAREAGFDGVEIHAANGYLIDQFLRDGSNRRTDAYGGSRPNRLRFLLEVTEAVLREWPPERVGVRLSPQEDYNDMKDSDPVRTFTEATNALDGFGLAYLHVIEFVHESGAAAQQTRVARGMRVVFRGPFILNGGFDAKTGLAAVAAGEADLISYGRWFLANPDLVERFRRGSSLNQPTSSMFYTPGPQGYTDYPALTS